MPQGPGNSPQGEKMAELIENYNSNIRKKSGNRVIEKNHNLEFISETKAADYFGVNKYDVRHYCIYRKCGVVINSKANARIERANLCFEYADDFPQQVNSRGA